jgi:arylsulfatase A
MKQNLFLFLFSFYLISFISCKSETSALPNIIILMADDLGYGDLGCFGGNANTPNLDQLAQEGIRFTDFYSAAPNCSPSRVGLLTGRFPSKVGMYNYMPANHPMHLKSEEITFAEIAKKKNYATGHFGKWHVSNLTPDSDLIQPQPDDQGFDYSLGTTNNARPSHLNPVNFVRNGVKSGEIKGYSCQIVVDEALEWLEDVSQNQSPYLLYIAFHEPHKKVASPPELTANYSQFPTQDAEYFANVENIDQAIGKLLSEIQSKYGDDNTLILFTSDNGSYRTGSNGDLLGGKSFVYEGGIRVPGIIRWKGNVNSGQTINTPVCLVDIMPTICDLTQVEHPNKKVLDGINLKPLLSGKPFERNKPLSWFFYRTSPEVAMRIGNYSLLGRNTDSTQHTHALTEPDMDHIKNMKLHEFELYDLSSDVGQAVNIFDQDPKSEQYKEIIIKRLEEIQENSPYWNNLPQAKGNKKFKSEWRQLHPTEFSN